MIWLYAGIAALILVLLVWEFYISEGAHLGRRFVRWLYQLTAPRYNWIKGYDRDWEIRYLGQPVAQVIGSLPGARVLDVGAGTGRLAWALEQSGGFRGSVVCVEPSRAMIGQQLPEDGTVRRRWLQGWADALPFPTGAFDVVASLEMLEFTPDPSRSLSELIRVLRPGGWLLLTNRIGWQAPLILGRTVASQHFPNFLEQHGLEQIEVFHWQVDYDLAWARKPYRPRTGG